LTKGRIAAAHGRYSLVGTQRSSTQEYTEELFTPLALSFETFIVRVR